MTKVLLFIIVLTPCISFGQYELQPESELPQRSIRSHFQGGYSNVAQIDFSDILFTSDLKILRNSSKIGIRVVNLLDSNHLVYHDTIDLNNPRETLSKYLKKARNFSDPAYEMLYRSDIPKKWVQAIENLKASGFRNFINKSHNDTVLSFYFDPNSHLTGKKLKVEYLFKDNLLREFKLYKTRKAVVVNHKSYSYDKRDRLLKEVMKLYNLSNRPNDTLPRMVAQRDFEKGKLTRDSQFIFDRNTAEKMLNNQYDYQYNSKGYLSKKKSLIHKGQGSEQHITELIEYSKKEVIYTYSESNPSGQQLIHFRTEYSFLK